MQLLICLWVQQHGVVSYWPGILRVLDVQVGQKQFCKAFLMAMLKPKCQCDTSQHSIYEAQLNCTLRTEKVVTIRLFLHSLQTEASELHEELMHDLLGNTA